MKRLVLTLVLILGLAGPSLAQTFLTTTTFVTAVSATADTVVLTSATGVAVGGVLYADHELMNVMAVSGTSVRVSRGQLGTAGAPHAGGSTGAIVIVAPRAAQQGALAAIGQSDPPAGSCTTSGYPYLPIINVVTGNIWSCRWVGSGTLTQKQWAATNIVMVNGQTSLIVQ